LQGDPVDDVLMFGIGQSNLFSLQAKYIPTNTVSASRLIDVSAWGGQQVELFFALMGSTSTNATLKVDNIRFYSFQQPRLGIVAMGNGLTLLSWPSTAAAYVAESSPDLGSPVWQTISNAPVITGDQYVLTNAWSDQTRFFRLRSR